MTSIGARELSVTLCGVPAHVGPVYVTLTHCGSVTKTESLSTAVAPHVRCFVTPFSLSADTPSGSRIELSVHADKAPAAVLAAFATTSRALVDGTTALYACPIVLYVHVEPVRPPHKPHPARPLAFCLGTRGVLNTSAFFARSTAAVPLELVVYRASDVPAEAVWIPIFRSRVAGQSTSPVARYCALAPDAPIRIEALRVFSSSSPSLQRHAVVLGALETTVGALRTTPEGGMIPLSLLSRCSRNVTTMKRHKKFSQSCASPGYIVVHPTLIQVAKSRVGESSNSKYPSRYVDCADATDPELSVEDYDNFDDDYDKYSEDKSCLDTLEFKFDLYCYASNGRRAESEAAALRQADALTNVDPAPAPESASSALQSEGDLSSFDEPFRPRMRSIVGEDDTRDYRKCFESASALDGGDSPFIVLARPRGKTFMASRPDRYSTPKFKLFQLPHRRHAVSPSL